MAWAEGRLDVAQHGLALAAVRFDALRRDPGLKIGAKGRQDNRGKHMMGVEGCGANPDG